MLRRPRPGANAGTNTSFRLASRRGRRAHRFGLAAAFVALVGFGPDRDPAEAYRFYDNGALDYIVGSDQAIRWSDESWGPGATLVWQVEEGPDWTLLWDSAEDFAPLVEEPLAIWSAVPTADISWRLTGVAEPGEESRFGDSRNRVFFDVDSFYGVAYYGATIWWIRNSELESWEITECDVGIPEYWVRWLENDRFDADDLRRWARDFLAREFGHCLGLGHAEQLPRSRVLRTSSVADEDGRFPRARFGTEVWPWNPLMSWGGSVLTEDDRIGASLLRPHRGWLASTGSLSGTLESEGQPVPYAYVHALRQGADGLRHPVGAFANAGGEFLIEGLPPGNYVLWAKPIRNRSFHRPLIDGGAATDLKDAVLAHPVPVTAGQITDGIVLPMRRGRK